jgi:acyl dehydratase
LSLEFLPVTAEIEKGHIRRFAEAIGDRNPLWTDEVAARKSRYGGIIAPPTFLRTLPLGRPDATLDLPGSRLLDGGSEWEYFVPVRPGDRVTATRRIVDLTERRSGAGLLVFVVALATYVNQLGEVVATQRTTSIRQEPAPGGGPQARPAPGPSRAPASSEAPASKAGPQATTPGAETSLEGLKEGDEVPPLVVKPTLQDLVRYAGASGDFNPLHYDRDFAVKVGLPGIIIHGALKSAWLGRLLTDCLGESGTLRKLAAQYRGVDFPGDTLTCRGVVLRRYTESGAPHIDLEVWLENGQGQRTTPCSATVVPPTGGA